MVLDRRDSNLQPLGISKVLPIELLPKAGEWGFSPFVVNYKTTFILFLSRPFKVGSGRFILVNTFDLKQL